MSVGIPIVSGASGAERPVAATPEPRVRTGPSFAEHVEVAGGAGQIPPEIRAEMQAAARAADRLREMGRQLHFERDEESGRIRIEVRDLDGNVLRHVPPGEVFDFASGGTVG